MKIRSMPLLISVLSLFIVAVVSGCTGTNRPDLADENSSAEMVQLSRVSQSSDVSGIPANPTEVGAEGEGHDLLKEDPTGKFIALPSINLQKEEIPILYSSHSNTLFYMKRTGSTPVDPYKKQDYTVLKGETSELVDIYSRDNATGTSRCIIKSVPYITVAKMNPQQDKAAFCGYDRLSIYDLSQNRLLLEKELENDAIRYFGWSPDGNILYTEHPNLPNGSILNLNENKLDHAYENNENLYFKGMLDRTRFIATNRLLIDEQKQKDSGGTLDEYQTVVTDKSGKILVELQGGRFRDSYGSSLLQTGINNFALYLYPDISKPESKLKLTDEFVYDVKFINGGYIAFLIKSDNIEANSFLLNICTPSGKTVALAEVSGSGLSVSPDGKSGFINGPAQEMLQFEPLVSSAGKTGITARKDSRVAESADQHELYAAIRGAMDIYFRNDMLGDEDYGQLDKYYTDSVNPEQCALTDMKINFDARSPGHYADFYCLNLHLSKLAIKGNRASASISGSCYNSFGSGMGMGHALELIKKGGKWFVTGFSTFPDSAQYKKIQSLLPGILKELQSGKLFKGELKGKEIKTGQIQFWQLSEPHLAESSQYANYCKVYLKVTAEGKETIYKLVLDKKNFKNWTPTILDKERLGFLS